MPPFPKSPGFNDFTYLKVPEKEMEFYKKRKSLFLMIVNGKTGLPVLPKDVSKIIYGRRPAKREIYNEKPKVIRHHENCCIL